MLFRTVPSWKHADEWYVFFENPRTKGFNILFTINGKNINPSGNIFWVKDKNFGMGTDHPIAWYRDMGKGRTFYTSMGHSAAAWDQPIFVRMLENVVSIANRK
jgi:uncharacterized protein